MTGSSTRIRERGSVGPRAILWMSCLLLAAAGLWPALATEAVDGEPESARTLVQRVSDSAPDVPHVAEMRLTTPGGLERGYTVSGKSLEEDLDARYFEVTDPFNLRGTRFLFYERTRDRDQQYTWMPALRRVMRMSEENRREPFLGSTFYVIDMLEPDIDDFTYRFVGAETVGGRACRLVESVPKRPAEELYGRSVFAIDPADLVIVRAELFDRDGKPFKLLAIEKLEKIEGYWTPMHQKMKNLRDDTVSELFTESIDYDAPLSDEMFHIAYVGR